MDGNLKKKRYDMDLFDEIKKMIVNVLALESKAVVAEAHLQDDLGGDSLAVMNLAEAIGEHYEIEMLADDIIETANVGELVELVQAKISSTA